MIRGVEKTAIPYVLEDDRTSPVKEQTIFWITPKTGHDSNRSLQRYAATGREGRKGYRELNVGKLDSADQEEFLAICDKVEVFAFPKSHSMYNNGQPHLLLEKKEELVEVVRVLSADHLAEIFEVANNLNKLEDGRKKGSSS